MTGLPEEAVRAVESLVTAFRDQATPSATNTTYEEWSSAFREWVGSHKSLPNAADWSREGIYAGRGE